MRLFIAIFGITGTGALLGLGAFVYFSLQVDWDSKDSSEQFGCGTISNPEAQISQSLPPEVAAGEALFKANCSACHKADKMLVGPQLAGVAKKYASDKEWLYRWVKNGPKLIQDGDPKAVALYEEYNQNAMMAFPTLSAEEIDAILAYADAYSR
ncbi:MAG: c-type cytochrome [Bacteroidia bacterium]